MLVEIRIAISTPSFKPVALNHFLLLRHLSVLRISLVVFRI